MEVIRMTGNDSINILPTSNSSNNSLFDMHISLCRFLLRLWISIVTLSFNNTRAPLDADNVDFQNDDAILQIVKVVLFNNTVPTSVAVDALRNLVYVSVKSGIPIIIPEQETLRQIQSMLAYDIFKGVVKEFP
jgi:hypothetical protein